MLRVVGKINGQADLVLVHADAREGLGGEHRVALALDKGAQIVGLDPLKVPVGLGHIDGIALGPGVRQQGLGGVHHPGIQALPLDGAVLGGVPGHGIVGVAEPEFPAGDVDVRQILRLFACGLLRCGAGDAQRQQQHGGQKKG